MRISNNILSSKAVGLHHLVGCFYFSDAKLCVLPPSLSLSTGPPPPLSDRHFVTNYITSIGGDHRFSSCVSIAQLGSERFNEFNKQKKVTFFYFIFCPSACIMFHFEQKREEIR